MATPLNNKNLSQIGAQIQVPKYDRSAVGQAIMHVGVGGFHRAHQALYADDLLHQGGDSKWGICGVGLLEQDAHMRDVMKKQDCLYTLVERNMEGDHARVIGSLGAYRFAPGDPEAVLAQMASADTHIVSMTITEGGYPTDSTTGELDTANEDIKHDLANPHRPRSLFGYVLEALDRRRQAGMAPFTVMSCDNVQSNGEVTRKVLMPMAELRDPKLYNWMHENCLFPNSMVDRITPSTTDEHRELVREKFGIEDGWPVMTESFIQWVIEDNFVLGRPEWERVGAQMTTDVLPYEKMKLRLLNASHQSLCYPGMLFGHEFVHEAMEEADICRFAERMMDEEVSDVLDPVPGVDLAEYKRTLIERFANPAIRDQLSRIGIYGSSGIPKFLLPSVKEQLARGGPITLMCLTVALWFRFLNGEDEAGKEMPMRDPMAPKLRDIARAAGESAEPLLAVRDVFGRDLAENSTFANTVSEQLKQLYRDGVRETLSRYVN